MAVSNGVHVTVGTGVPGTSPHPHGLDDLLPLSVRDAQAASLLLQLSLHLLPLLLLLRCERSPDVH